MVDVKAWPERLKLRDTQLHDDLGGMGQRIYTTAGQGYERVEYVRADLCSVPDRGTTEPASWIIEKDNLLRIILRQNGRLIAIGEPAEEVPNEPL